MLTVRVVQEAGYAEAMLGLSLSFNQEVDKMPPVAAKLAHRVQGNQAPGGENKFLEAMVVWLDVRAPRYWWQEADTYRLSTKQSESTMHTILKHPLAFDDFQEDGGYEDPDPGDEEFDRAYLAKMNEKIKAKKFRWVKRHLIESFFQRRVWTVSYKTLQNMWYQRRKHKLPEWQQFWNQVMPRLTSPDFVRNPEIVAKEL
jgi:hypothetical protein